MYKRMLSGKKIWILHCLLLYSPFFCEAVYSLLIKNVKEPSAYWFFGLYFLLCFIAYGFVCIVHIKWRKKIGEPADFTYAPNDIKPVFISILIGFTGSKISEFLIYGHVFLPMPISDIKAYFIDFSPRSIGAAGFILQYIYYGFEFTLVTLFVDCAQKMSEKYNLSRKIPWGGLFLAFTWGLGHVFTKNNIQDGLHSFFTALCMGSAYLLPENKKLNVWFAAAAVFFL